MRVLADFLIDSDLCVPEAAPPIAIRDIEENVEFSIANVSVPKVGEPTQLTCRILFDANGLDEAPDRAFALLAVGMNALVYATNRKFALRQLLKVVDWTPGIAERSAIIFHESPLDDRAEPALDAAFGETAERLIAMRPDHKQASAMRWYRLGIGSTVLEEQFSYLWFSLEIAAQATKSAEKTASKCPRCRNSLYCEVCKTHPTHRPYAGEAIRQAVEREVPNGSDEVFETLQKIRHTLMHGDRIDSIANELPCLPEKAVHKLATIAWSAIGRMFSRPDPLPEKPISFGFVDSVVRKNLVAGFKIKIGYPGDPSNPCVEDFPKINVTVEYIPQTE